MALKIQNLITITSNFDRERVYFGCQQQHSCVFTSRECIGMCICPPSPQHEHTQGIRPETEHHDLNIRTATTTYSKVGNLTTHLLAPTLTANLSPPYSPFTSLKSRGGWRWRRLCTVAALTTVVCPRDNITRAADARFKITGGGARSANNMGVRGCCS